MMPARPDAVRRLDGKVALVTGSSRGIGAAIAQLFAAHGAHVALHGRDRTALAEVHDAISRNGGRAITTTGDVTRYADIEAMRSTIERQLGSVDVLVANAGASLTKPAPLEEIPEDGWRASVDANLTATFLTLKSFLPGMKARRSGSIITISSLAARSPHAMAPIPYAAAKAGIQTMTQDLALQVGPLGIRVNCIAPGTVLTERNQERIPAERQRAMNDAVPLRRLGTPADIAEAALYLASADAAWVTGVVLDVSGGATMS
jgi:3-oxoacyl-[acyl-carrier protein] reductase